METIGFGEDSGWIEITGNLTRGDNIIEFTNENGHEGEWAYGFELKRDDSIIWSDSCGTAGSLGCNYNDLTRGLVYRNIITLKLETVSPTLIDKKITLGPYDRYSRYYIHMYKDANDIAKMKINGKLITTMSFRQDSGWIDITGYLNEDDNTIELTDENGPEGGWAYGFEFKQNDSIIWSDSCGIPGSPGCKDNDISRGLVYRNLITLKLIPIPLTTSPVLTPTAITLPAQMPAQTPISVPSQKAQVMTSFQKLSGVLAVIISILLLLWFLNKLRTPK